MNTPKPEKDKETKASFLHLRVSEDEKKWFMDRAKKAGNSQSEHFRVLAFGEYKSAKKQKSELLRQVAMLGNNLNQVARWANTHKEKTEAKEVLSVLLSIERQAKKLVAWRVKDRE